MQWVLIMLDEYPVDVLTCIAPLLPAVGADWKMSVPKPQSRTWLSDLCAPISVPVAGRPIREGRPSTHLRTKVGCPHWAWEVDNGVDPEQAGGGVDLVVEVAGGAAGGAAGAE